MTTVRRAGTEALLSLLLRALTVVVLVAGRPGPVLAQSLLDRPARLSVQRVPVAEALAMLRASSGTSLVYSSDVLPRLLVSCDCETRTVGQALAVILRDTDLTFRTSGAGVLIVPRRDGATALTGVLIGTVLDAATGVPVPSVAVRIETGQGVLTDDAGRFSIADVARGLHVLEVSGIGWEPWVDDNVSVRADDTTSVTVRLRQGVVPLPEIVVSPGTFGMLESVPPNTVRAISRKEIESSPQLGEDVFRSLTRLPGVSAHDISTRLSVRGSLDREVLVRLDGVELHEPYHLQDWGGVFGIVDLNALEGVALKSGGYGVELGNRGAAVLDMSSVTAVGPPRAAATLNVSHVSLVGRGGFAGDRGSWLLSGREGTLGLLMRLMGEDDRLSPRFYDLFGKLSFQVSGSHLLALHALHAGDQFHLDLDEWDGISTGPGIEGGAIRSDWSSSYVWATWTARWSQFVSSRTNASIGRVARLREGNLEDVASIDTPEEVAVLDDRAYRFATVRHETDVEVTDDVMVRVGGEASTALARYDYFAETRTPFLAADGVGRLRTDTVRVAFKPTGDRIAAFAAVRARTGDRLTTELGVRYDRISQTKETHLSPRIQSALSIGRSTVLRASLGRYSQDQGVGDLQVGDGQTLYSPAERSDLLAVGLEHRVNSELSVRIEAYQRRISDQQPRFIGLEQELRIFPEQQGDRLRIDPGKGRAQGIELIVEGGRWPAWSWSAGYTLAEAVDEFHSNPDCPPTPTCLEDPWVPRSRDQRHSLDVQVDFRPTERFHLAVAWTFHTGWPATAWSYQAEPRADGSPFITRTFGPLRGERLPSYHRLDLRGTQTLTLGGGTLEVYADLFNVYDHRNRGSYQYGVEYLGGGQIRTVRTDESEDLIPFLPMVGLRYRF